MKQETKIRIFFGIVMLCILVHFLYYSWQIGLFLPSGLFFIGGWAPLTMLYAVLPPKKMRTPNYSKALSFAGILISLCSFVIYFSWFMGIWSSSNLAFILSMFVLIYSVFLSWYKNGWWG